MSTFSKALKYRKPLKVIESKLEQLNRELKITGIDEAITNATSGVYVDVKTTPAEVATPPVYSAVPNTSGIGQGGFSQTIGGDGTLPTEVPKIWTDPGYGNIDQMVNSSELDGITNRPILNTPWNTSSNGQTGLLYSQGIHNSYYFTLDANNQKVSYDQHDDSVEAAAFREYYQNEVSDANNYPPGPGWITWYYWVPFSIFNSRIDAYWPGSGQTPEYQGVVKGTSSDGYALLSDYMWVGGSYAEYMSQAAGNHADAYTTLISRYSIDDASYYAGNPLDYLRSFLDIGKTGYKALTSKAASKARQDRYPKAPRDPSKPSSYYNDAPDGTTYDEWKATGKLKSDSKEGITKLLDKGIDIASLPSVEGKLLIDIIRNDPGSGARDHAIQQIQKHAPKTYKKLLQKGLVQQGANPLVAVKGKGGSPYQEYEDPNKDKKFVPPPKDMQKPGEPPIKKVDKFSLKSLVAQGIINDLNNELKVASSLSEGLILSESWWDDPAPEDKSPKRSSRPQLQNEPYISLTEKDILKHHKLKELEREDLMNTIDEINLYLDENPTAIDFIKERYPANDTRTAELNWKTDQMLDASAEYIEQQFPVNQSLFSRIKKITKKNIELTDPKNFDPVKEPPKFVHLQKDVMKLKEVVSRHFHKPKPKTKKELLDERISKLNKEISLTMGE